MAKTTTKSKANKPLTRPKLRKTFSHKASDVRREWYLIDASTAPIGRIASLAATYLIGKHKVTFTPHVDGGDYVVIINAKQVIATGDKEIAKRYFHHTGFPGGIKETSLAELRNKHPERILERAISGMLLKNKLRADRMKRLKVYADDQHCHEAQQPQKVEVK